MGERPRPLWVVEDGPCSDVVISTRCRAARNLDGVAFPWRASTRELGEAWSALSAAWCTRYGADVAVCAEFERLSASDRDDLAVERIVSADWLRATGPRGVIVNTDGVLSGLVHEEDHLRAQAVMPGLRARECMSRSLECVDGLGIGWAHEPNVGYLTASLTNAGTGMRVGALVHLPGLSIEERVTEVMLAAHDLGCSVRGVGGEGTSASGHLYQVSNAYAFGPSAERPDERVEAAVRFVVSEERACRSRVFASPSRREDLLAGVGGAIALLIDEGGGQAELLGALSLVRVAVSEGLLTSARCDIAYAMSNAALVGVGVLPMHEIRAASVVRSARIRRFARIWGAELRDAPPRIDTQAHGEVEWA